MKSDPDHLHAFAQSRLSMAATALYVVLLIPALILFHNAGDWGLPGFALAFIVCLYLHGVHVDFDGPKREVRVTKAWLYFFRMSSRTFPFEDVELIKIDRSGDHENIKLIMASRTYWLDGMDSAEKFFNRLCKMFPQFIAEPWHTARKQAEPRA